MDGGDLGRQRRRSSEFRAADDRRAIPVTFGDWEYVPFERIAPVWAKPRLDPDPRKCEAMLATGSGLRQSAIFARQLPGWRRFSRQMPQSPACARESAANEPRG